MAMYHFRLKSDKKPNGTKISAVKHVEYINREGAFSEDEHEKGNDKFVGNFITTEKTPNVFGGENELLYKTDSFGLIRNTERGIEVTENASETTIATALVLCIPNADLLCVELPADNLHPCYHDECFQTGSKAHAAECV